MGSPGASDEREPDAWEQMTAAGRRREEPRAPRSGLPLAYRISRFLRTHGWHVYHNPRWPTRDHVIPIRLFGLLDAVGEHVRAAEKLQLVEAVAHGTAVANNGKDSAVRSMTDRLTRFAYPEVRYGKK